MTIWNSIESQGVIRRHECKQEGRDSMWSMREFWSVLKPAMIGPVMVLMLCGAGVIVPKDYKFGLCMGVIIIAIVILAAAMAYRKREVKSER